MKKYYLVLLIISLLSCGSVKAQECVKPVPPNISECIPLEYILTSCVYPTSNDQIIRQSEELLYNSCSYLKNSRNILYKTSEDIYNKCTESNQREETAYSDSQEVYSACLLKTIEQYKTKNISDIYLKQSISNYQKLYPDANITGLEKTSEQIRNKILKSGSYLAYHKIKPLTADQIVENINILGNSKDGTVQDMQNYIDFLKQYQKIPKLSTKSHPAYSVSKLASIIKSRYPEFVNTKNSNLVKDFVLKYPFLKDRVK